MVDSPLMSIIITGYTVERLKDIYELLDSVKAQTYTNIETIFVVENSLELYDKIDQYARENNIPNPKVLHNTGERGLSAGRNVGIKESKGDILAFVDDDTVLSANWGEEVVKAFADDSVIGVTGPALPLWEDKSMSWFPEEFYWIISCIAWSGWHEMREVSNSWGQGMAFRREAFEMSGLFSNEFGFHKGSMAEDNEFSLRAKAKTGKRIIYCPTVRLLHRVHKYRLSWGFIRERSYWIGYSRYMMKKSYPNSTDNKTAPLTQELQLLNRIITRLLPSIARDLFFRPVTAWRRLSVTVVALYYVALGYYSHWLPFTSELKSSGGVVNK